MKLTKKEFAAMMDHSAVSQDNTMEYVEKVCQETIDNGFATAYMLACHVKWARNKFGSDLVLGTDSGYPQGCDATITKLTAGLQAIKDGADVLDITNNLNMMRSNNFDYCAKELKYLVTELKSEKPDLIIKIIVDNCLMDTLEQKLAAVDMVLESGADVIKTNTGYGGYGARASDIRIMKQRIGDRNLPIKAAGDCEDAGQALELILAGATQIGNSRESIWRMMDTFDDYYPYFKDL